MRSSNLLGAFGAVWLVVCAGAAGQAPGGGDIASLATSMSVEPCGKSPYGGIVTVKVANRGKKFAEPLTFELSPKDGPLLVLRRAPGPYLGRAGRPTPPGGTQSYPILVLGEHAKLEGAKCKVGDVVFLDASPTMDPPVEIGAPTTEKRKHELGATVEHALLPLKNLRDKPIDVILRIGFERPRAETILVHRRLDPNEAVVASFKDLALEPTPAVQPKGHEVSVDFVVPPGARIGSAKVVDWCGFTEGGGPDAGKLLHEAYSKWLRWEHPPSGISGGYTATLWPHVGSPRLARGKFGISAAGDVTEQPEGAVSEDDRNRINDAIETAFKDLRRPAADEAVPLCKAAVDSLGPPIIVACAGDTWNPAYRWTRFALAQGRFVGHSWSGGQPTDLHVEWRDEPFEGGYVVVERRAFNISNRGTPTEVQRFRYVRAHGMLVPLRFTIAEDLSPSVPPWTLELVFRDITPDASAGAVVASPAAEALRSAWNSGYRYPGTRIACTCRFVVKPGKDLVWRGVKEARGRITFTELDGAGRGAPLIEVDGVTEESVKRSLAFSVDDRLGMWTGRDFAARGDFDRVFAGASFTENSGSPGVFDVKDGPYASLVVKDGRIAGMTFRNGALRSFTWSKVAGQDVVTRVITGPEDLKATYVPVGPLLIPAKMVFKGVFGDEKEWGVEDLQLSDFVVK